MNQFKKAVVVGAAASLLFVSSTNQTFAADNIFQRVQKTVSSRMDNLYLRFVPGKKSGKLVLKQMAESYSTLKSFESDTDIDATFTGAGKTFANAKIKAAGSTQVTDIWNPSTYKQDLKMTGNVAFEGTTLSAIADLKMIDGVSYVLISQLPALPGVPLDKLKNNWIKMNQTSVDSQLTPNAEQQQRLQAAMMTLLENAQVSDAAPEKKDGESVFMLDLTLPKDAVADYMVTTTSIQREMMHSAPEVSTDEMKENFMEGLEAVGDLKMKLWVERSNYYPTYFEMPLEIDVKKYADMSASANPMFSEVEKANITITSDMRKFNEPVTITPPENAQDIQTLMGQVGGPTLTGEGEGNDAMMVQPGQVRKPTVGTSELPELTEWQKQQLDMYDNR